MRYMPKNKIMIVLLISGIILLVGAILYFTGKRGGKMITVGKQIKKEDITDFYFTYDSSTDPPMFQRYRFFKENDVTDAQATEVKGIIDSALKLMNDDGAASPEKLSTVAKKQELLEYSRKVASILGYTVSYDGTEKRLDVYKDGTQVDSLYWGVYVDENGNKVSTTEPQLAKTGSTNYIYAIAAGVVLIAGIAYVVARKKANA